MYLKNFKNIVIKIGSSLLINDKKNIRKKWLSEFAKDIRDLLNNKKNVIIVSSGSIALGCKKLNLNKKKLKLDKSQAVASIGQIELMNLYQNVFKKLKIMHYDLYRIKNSTDINELGIFTEIKDHITLIEWPELIEKKPEDRVEMFFSYTEENLKKRNIKINGYGKWSNYDFKKI